MPSYDQIKAIRDLLINDATVTSYVNANDITVGWVREVVDFPSIIITNAGGSSRGYIGNKNTSSGNRVATETLVIQIDIVSRTSVKNTYDIADAISDVLLANGYSKSSDNDFYVDDFEAYRKVVIWNITRGYDF